MIKSDVSYMYQEETLKYLILITEIYHLLRLYLRSKLVSGGDRRTYLFRQKIKFISFYLNFIRKINLVRIAVLLEMA